MRTKKFFSAIVITTIAIFGMLAAFRLPYRFPPTAMVVGASYDYGFNNTVGVIIILVLAAIYFFTGWTCQSKIFDLALLERPFKTNECCLDWKEFRMLAVISVLLILAMYLFSGDFGFGESNQFFLAIERIAGGAQPYIDFDFYYGPLLAYFPYSIFKLLSILGGDIKAGYFVSLGLLQVIGLWELGYILNQVASPTKQKRLIFCILGFSTLPIHSGINVILFRYLTPIALFIMLRNHKPVSLFLQSTALAVFNAIIFGISVEYGVIFMVATCFFHIFEFMENRCYREFILIFVCIMTALLIWFLYPGLFDTVRLYLMGAWRWPFIESFSLGLFFISVFCLAFAVGVQMKRPVANRIDISVSLIAFGSLPAALGRCDPHHVLLNGLGILILSYCYVMSVAGKRFSVCYGLSLVIVFGFMLNISLVRLYLPVYGKNFAKWISIHVQPDHQRQLFLAGGRFLAMAPVDVERKIEKFQSQAAFEYERFFEGNDSVACPFLTPYEIKIYLKSSGKYIALYFKDFYTLASENEISLAVSELAEKQPSSLLLPVGWLNMTQPIDYSGQIDMLFFASYKRKPLRNGQVIFFPLTSYVSSNYFMSDKLGDFSLWKRKIEIKQL